VGQSSYCPAPGEGQGLFVPTSWAPGRTGFFPPPPPPPPPKVILGWPIVGVSVGVPRMQAPVVVGGGAATSGLTSSSPPARQASPLIHFREFLNDAEGSAVFCPASAVCRSPGRRARRAPKKKSTAGPRWTCCASRGGSPWGRRRLALFERNGQLLVRHVVFAVSSGTWRPLERSVSLHA